MESMHKRCVQEIVCRKRRKKTSGKRQRKMKKMEGGIRDGGVNSIKGRKELKNVKGREKLQYVRKGQEKKKKTTFNPTDSEKDEYLQRKKNSKKKKY